MHIFHKKIEQRYDNIIQVRYTYSRRFLRKRQRAFRFEIRMPWNDLRASRHVEKGTSLETGIKNNNIRTICLASLAIRIYTRLLKRFSTQP